MMLCYPADLNELSIAKKSEIAIVKEFKYVTNSLRKLSDR